MDVDTLRVNLCEVADPHRAPQMAAYMRHRFEFFGVGSKQRRVAARSTLAAATQAAPDRVVAFAEDCWVQPEREFAYVACDALGANAARLRVDHLPRIKALIITKSWWDTVDPLATHTVGALVADHRELAAVMDDWIRSDNLWLARTAILHQLRWGEATDADRLFAYARLRAEDPDFFIRKALGWALRQYARVDPDAVRTFVARNTERLSPLTTREALKHLGAPGHVGG